ncbi:MAG: RDD family protein [Microthrixaceae bacterium]
MSVTPSMGIVTPEAVVLEFRTAGLATRAWAKLIDVVLLITFASFLTSLLSVLTVTGASVSPTVGIVVSVVSLFVVLLILPAWWESRHVGVTPGKSAVGLRVVTVQGGPIRFRQAFMRHLAGLVEIPTGIALVVAIANRRSQRVGDLAAGTFVILERSVNDTTVPIAFLPPPGLDAFCHALDVSRLDSEQFLLVRNLLLRVGGIETAARVALTERLASAIDKVTTPAPPPMTAETFLICVCCAYQIRHGGLRTAGRAPTPSPPWYPNAGPGRGAVLDAPGAPSASSTVPRAW